MAFVTGLGPLANYISHLVSLELCPSLGYGGKPEVNNTLTGSLRNTWMNVKTAVVGGDIKVIISDCARSARAAQNAYEETFSRIGGESLASLEQKLRSQHEQLMAEYKEMETIEEALKFVP